MSRCRGTVSKALLMSIAVSSVRWAGLGWLRPSSMVWVRLDSRVDVECCGLKPCWASDNGMWWLMRFRTSLSSTFDGVHRRDMGLYEAGSVGDLLGLRIGRMLAVFQMWGMLLCCIEELKMSVRILMA